MPTIIHSNIIAKILSTLSPGNSSSPSNQLQALPVFSSFFLVSGFLNGCFHFGQRKPSVNLPMVSFSFQPRYKPVVIKTKNTTEIIVVDTRELRYSERCSFSPVRYTTSESIPITNRLAVNTVPELISCLFFIARFCHEIIRIYERGQKRNVKMLLKKSATNLAALLIFLSELISTVHQIPSSKYP